MSALTGVRLIEGVVCDDRFVRRVARDLGDGSIRVLLVPPGRTDERAAHALASAAGAHVLMLRGLDAETFGPENILRALEEHLGLLPADADDVEDLVLRNIQCFAFPRSFVIVLDQAGAGHLRTVIETAARLSEYTKNLAGPMTFAIVSAGTRAALDGCSSSPVVWEPLDTWPEHLPVWEGSPDLEMVGFRTYLSLRIYWEGAGQPESIERLAPLHLRAAELVAASDTDGRIDAAFEASARERALPAAELMEVFDAAFDTISAQAVIHNGFVVGSRLPAFRLLAAGVAWRPPGVPHCYITGAAARVLAGFAPFRARHRLDNPGAASFRRAVHQNCFLASWIMSLTSFVEYEMMAICKSERTIDAAIAQLGLDAPLRVARERSPRQLAYDPADDLLSYASFGELQRLVLETSVGKRFPVSARRLNEVRNVRNLVAHLHPVTWPAVRAVLLALQEMRSTM